jgi:hypothetical protein
LAYADGAIRTCRLVRRRGRLLAARLMGRVCRCCQRAGGGVETSSSRGESASKGGLGLAGRVVARVDRRRGGWVPTVEERGVSSGMRGSPVGRSCLLLRLPGRLLLTRTPCRELVCLCSQACCRALHVIAMFVRHICLLYLTSQRSIYILRILSRVLNPPCFTSVPPHLPLPQHEIRVSNHSPRPKASARVGQVARLRPAAVSIEPRRVCHPRWRPVPPATRVWGRRSSCRPDPAGGLVCYRGGRYEDEDMAQ